MRLEDEIHQKFFKTPQQKLAVNLIYTTNWVHNHYLEHFKNTELTMQQYNVMRILRGQYPTPCSLKVIKERMLDRMSDASRIVDKLVAKNFVIRNQCPNDRRSVNLIISEKGLAVLKEIDVIDDATVEMFNNLNPEETNLLNDLLDKLRG